MDNKQGVYVALRVLGQANDVLNAFIVSSGFPAIGTLKERRRHVTVIYSRAYVELQPLKSVLYQARGKRLRVFDEADGRRCLVVELDAPEVVARHNGLLLQHPDLKHDFEDYIPHITLSYDIGSFDVSTLSLPDFSCVLGDEYVKDLNLG